MGAQLVGVVLDGLAEQDPDNGTILSAQAYCYYKLENRDKAFELYHKILEREPDNYMARFNYASLLAEEGYLPEAMETYQQLLGMMDAMEMVIVTSDYWGAVHGADPGEVLQDTEGIEVAAKLARNMAWAVKVINMAKGKIDPPETNKRTFTNFIR